MIETNLQELWKPEMLFVVGMAYVKLLDFLTKGVASD